MAEHVSLSAATSARCSRCGILVTYGCLAARLTYRVCYKCAREMLAPGEWLGYLPPLPERERIHVLHGERACGVWTARRGRVVPPSLLS